MGERRFRQLESGSRTAARILCTMNSPEPSRGKAIGSAATSISDFLAVLLT
jgi:hypothetical protein